MIFSVKGPVARGSQNLCADTGLHAPTQLSGLLSLQEFIRLGSLSKLSGKGLQQRMFFLVSGLGCRSSL